MNKLHSAIQQISSLNELLLTNLIPNSTKPICFHHFAIWEDNFRRISIENDPFINLAIRVFAIKQHYQTGVKQ